MRANAAELRALGATLGTAGPRLVIRLDPVLKAAATDVKATMQAGATRPPGTTIPGFARTIGYDPVRGAAAGAVSFGYEIGPDKDRGQGALGNLLYFGTSRRPPVLDIDAAWEGVPEDLVAKLSVAAVMAALT